MYINPSIQSMLETVISSLARDIAPELSSSRAKTCLGMAQSMLQCVMKRASQEHEQLCREHNEMTALLRDIAAELTASTGGAAERIQERSLRLGGQPDLPAPPPLDALRSAYSELSGALVNTLDDLDELMRNGEGKAQAALERLRRYLLTRTLREVETMQVNPGSLAGRE